jgi:hypothetical protein
MSDGQDIHLDSDQRTRLLRIGLSEPSSEDKDVEPDEKRTDYLYQILVSTLPVAQKIRAALPDLIVGQAQDLSSISGKSIGELIQDRETDLATLTKIKKHSRQRGMAADSKEEEDACMAVYFAAIASALVSHGAKISDHEDKDLPRFFDSFVRKPWVIEELRGLLKRASDYAKRNS